MPGQLRLRKHRTLLLGLALSLSVATLTFVATGLRAQGGAHDNRRRSPGGAGGRHAAGPEPRIPRIVHHIYVSSGWALPAGASVARPSDLVEYGFPGITADMQTWYDLNAPDGFTYRFWDKPALEGLIRSRYTDYWAAWEALPKDVERSDFARYIVLHHAGGYYSDSDVTCVRPVAGMAPPGDTLLAVWEGAWSSEAETVANSFGRQAQVANWFMAAAPGHPALRYVMEHVRLHAASRMFDDASRDTVERTGPGAWTEAVLFAAFRSPPSQQGGAWGARVLPKIVAGWHPHDYGWMAPPVYLVHTFRSSWKGGAELEAQRPAMYPPGHVTPLAHPLLPTSAAFDPPFTLLHHRRGEGDAYEGADVSLAMMQFGAWQAGGGEVEYPPRQIERLLAGLEATTPRAHRGTRAGGAGGAGGAAGGPGAAAVAGPAPAAHGGWRHRRPGGGRRRDVVAAAPSDAPKALLLDIGAGYGFASLAAAARGHPVLAFEAAKSAAALSASIAYNGFKNAKLVAAALGDAAAVAEEGHACVDPLPDGPAEAPAAGAPVAAAAAAVAAAILAQVAPAAAPAAAAAAARFEGSGPAAPWQQEARAHGYWLPGAPEGGSSVGGRGGGSGNCSARVPRLDAAAAVEAVLPNGARIGAVRVAAHGWAPRVLRSLEPLLLAHRPQIILIEWRGRPTHSDAASSEAASSEAAPGEAAPGEAAPGEAALGEAALGEAAPSEAASSEGNGEREGAAAAAAGNQTNGADAGGGGGGAASADHTPAEILTWLAARGWGSASHAGPECRARWRAARGALRWYWPGEQPLELDGVGGGTCPLPPGHYAGLEVAEGVAEVIFVERRRGAVRV